MIDSYYWNRPYDDEIPARRADAAAVWAEALATECPPEGDVSCAPETFAPIVWTDGLVHVLDTSVEVVGDDPSRVREAVVAASRRFGLVDATGREWPSFEELEAVLEEESVDWEATFTPEYVSELEEHDGAVGFWFDVEGNPYPTMVRSQLRILLEELARAGVTQARIRPLTGFADGS